ncbi:hypothetical protein LINPERPRIM_LOCUS37797 [Linum perenne]
MGHHHFQILTLIHLNKILQEKQVSYMWM